MKILITGADGQLGRSLRKIAPEYPQHGFVFTDLPEADITDREAMEALAGRHEPDAIVNCAAYTAVDRAEGDPDTAMSINRDGPAVLGALAARRGIPLIHISTDYVFDGRAARPIGEEDTPAPLGVYGRTKLAGEDAVRSSGCDAAVVRTAWLYSEFGHNFVKTMLSLGAQGKDISVVDDQTGCPTYATDLARALLVVLERGVHGFRVYNFCNAGQTTWYGFARKIFDLAVMPVLLRPVSTAEYPTAALRPPYSVLSTERIRAIGAVTPEWEESLARCLRIIEQN